MATVIPKQPKKERDPITIRLDREVLETLEHYRRYLESGRGYVINRCLTFRLSQSQAVHSLACRPLKTAPEVNHRRRHRIARKAGCGSGTPSVAE